MSSCAASRTAGCTSCGRTSSSSASTRGVHFDDVDGIPTARTLDALFAAGRELTPHQLAFAIGRARYAGDATLDAITAALDHGPPRHGAATVRAAMRLCRDGSAGTRCRSEDRLLPVVTSDFRAPLVNVRGAAGLADYEPDFCWPRRRWIVEIDGGHHLDEPVRLADAERDAFLRSQGWVVIRVWWRDVWDDLPEVRRRIRAEFGGDRGKLR